MAKDYAWAIYLIRAKGELVGWVYAPDRKTAIARAIEKFEITNVEQQSLTRLRLRPTRCIVPAGTEID